MDVALWMDGRDGQTDLRMHMIMIYIQSHLCQNLEAAFSAISFWFPYLPQVHHDVKHGEGKDLAKELEHAPG